jgi:hypothetical protein
MSTEPQEIYARWLQTGSKIAFAFALVVFVLYLAGVPAPLVPLDELPRLWTLSAADMMREAHEPGGRSWIRFLRYSDYLDVLAISLFPLLALVCVARVIPDFVRRGERLQAVLAALQVLVLLFAAL